MREYHDPLTGDRLTSLEYLTRQAQTIVRTPWFFVVFNLITMAALFLHQLEKWNYLASWLAIIIEWLVGTYFFGQTGRDAVILRAIKRDVEQEERDIAAMRVRRRKVNDQPRDERGRWVRREKIDPPDAREDQ